MSDVQPIDLDDLVRVGVLVRIQLGDNWLADMVEIAAAEIARLREERLTFCTVDGYPGKFRTKPLPPGPEANG